MTRVGEGGPITRGAAYFLALSLCVPAELVNSLLRGTRPFLMPLATGILLLAWLVVREARSCTPWRGAYPAIWGLLAAFLIWATAVAITSPQTPDSLADVAAYATRFAMVYALVQLLAADMVSLERVWRFIPAGLSVLVLLSFAGIVGAGSSYETMAGALKIDRVAVGIGDANLTALALNVGLCGALASLAAGHGLRQRGLALAATAVLVIGVARTVSLGGLAGLLLVLVLTALRAGPGGSARRPFVAVVAAGIAVLTIGIAGAAYYARAEEQVVLSEANAGALGSERLNLAAGGVRMVWQHPLTGVGSANVASSMPLFLPFAMFRPNQGAHNLFIEVADESGLPAALLLIAVFAYAFGLLRQGLHQARAANFRRGYLTGSSLGIAIAATLVQSMAVASQRDPFLWLLVALALAYPLAQARTLGNLPVGARSA